MSVAKDELRATASETMHDDKEQVDAPDVIPKPESIQHMSAEELKKLERRMVLKMDIVIM